MTTSRFAKVKSDCREFVEVLQEFLEEAKREGSITRYQDFYEEYPSYLNIRNGQTGRPPVRSEVEKMAKTLRLSAVERNKLLVAAGHFEEDEEPEGEDLVKALNKAQGIIDYLPFPAYAVTRNGIIHCWNPLTLKLFFLGKDELSGEKEENRNVLRYIFDPRTPVYGLLTNSGNDFSWWRYTAKLNIYRFKKDNLRYRNKPWYEERVKSLMDFPGFETIWDKVDIATGSEEVKKERSEELTFSEYVTKIYTPDGRRVKVRGLQMSVVDTDFPRIVAYIPDDKESIGIFTDFGFPTPRNGWTQK